MTLGPTTFAPLVAFVEAVLGAGGAPLSAVVLVGLLGAATAVIVLGLSRVVLTLCGLAGAVPEATLREEAGTRLLVWRRDPDARGHVRSRAPGRAVAAA
jgi:hypothetical protein